MFLNEMGDICDRTQGFERIGDLVTYFLVKARNFVYQSRVRDLKIFCFVLKRNGL
jgi:hypothetical protein